MVLKSLQEPLRLEMKVYSNLNTLSLTSLMMRQRHVSKKNVRKKLKRE